MTLTAAVVILALLAIFLLGALLLAIALTAGSDERRAPAYLSLPDLDRRLAWLNNLPHLDDEDRLEAAELHWMRRHLTSSGLIVPPRRSPEETR